MTYVELLENSFFSLHNYRPFNLEDLTKLHQIADWDYMTYKETVDKCVELDIKESIMLLRDKRLDILFGGDETF